MKRFFLPLLIVCFSMLVSYPLVAQNQLREKITTYFSTIPVVGHGTPFLTPLPGIQSLAMSLPGAVADEIKQLASSLSNDPLRIFSQVRNHIYYEAYHGLHKCEVMTHLEGSANDFNQCVILAEHLKVAGYTNIEYPHRGMLVNYQDLIPWLGFAPEAFHGKTFFQVTSKSIQEFFGANHNGVGDADSDGLTKADELAKGTDPSNNQTSPTNASAILYDSVGRLTDSDVNSWSYDAEGNLESAQ